MDLKQEERSRRNKKKTFARGGMIFEAKFQ
jgi:hypothetical protein